MRNLKTLVRIVCFLACTAASTLAAPFDETITFTQPDGTEIVLSGRGDEFHAVFETLDGYTVLFNHLTKAYEYANISTDGNSLVSSGLVVGRDDSKKFGATKHIKINAEATKKQVKERFQKWDQELHVSTRWGQIKAARRQADHNGSNGPQLAPSDFVSSDTTSTPELAPPTTATTGTKVGLTLLIDFSDDPATVPQANIINYCNGDNFTDYGNNGSVKKYFQDNSGGLLTYSNVVTIYIRVPNPKTYYNDTSVYCGDEGRKLIGDAITAMQALPNYTSEILPTFSSLTVDGSSRVLACNVFFAGGKSGVWNYGLWPHSWALARAC